VVVAEEGVGIPVTEQAGRFGAALSPLHFLHPPHHLHRPHTHRRHSLQQVYNLFLLVREAVGVELFGDVRVAGFFISPVLGDGS